MSPDDPLHRPRRLASAGGRSPPRSSGSSAWWSSVGPIARWRRSCSCRRTRSTPTCATPSASSRSRPAPRSRASPSRTSGAGPTDGASESRATVSPAGVSRLHRDARCAGRLPAADPLHAADRSGLPRVRVARVPRRRGDPVGRRGDHRRDADPDPQRVSDGVDHPALRDSRDGPFAVWLVSGMGGRSSRSSPRQRRARRGVCRSTPSRPCRGRRPYRPLLRVEASPVRSRSASSQTPPAASSRSAPGSWR